VQLIWHQPNYPKIPMMVLWIYLPDIICMPKALIIDMAQDMVLALTSRYVNSIQDFDFLLHPVFSAGKVMLKLFSGVITNVLKLSRNSLRREIGWVLIIQQKF
jgi:hypothetical protein